MPAQTLTRDGRTYELSRVKAAQWPAAATVRAGRPGGSPAHLRTDPAPRTGEKAARQGPAARKPRALKSLADRTGPPVLYTGPLRHYNRSAMGRVQFPGQRWLRFPVRGTGRSNAIMTAVDQAGRQVARYRIAHPVFTGWRAIEITVHPDQRLTDELLLTLTLTAPWVSSFFNEQG